MVEDFEHGIGRYDERGQERYDEGDLLVGVWYAEQLMGDGYTVDPFLFINLHAFKEWCHERA
jgi:hypothetical protein